MVFEENSVRTKPNQSKRENIERIAVNNYDFVPFVLNRYKINTPITKGKTQQRNRCFSSVFYY